MKKVLVSAVLAAGMFGCAATAPEVEYVVVTIPPPAAQVEPVPDARPGHLWSAGHYDWQGNKHVWVPGKWVVARQGATYQPNRWVERDGRWNLERERWRDQ